MSGLEDLFGLCGICFLCCCCLESVQNNNLWCFLSCCNGRRYRVRGSSGGCCSCRRTMNDEDFERTVEELYGNTKPEDVPGQSTHVVALQPMRSGEGTDGRVDKQPGPRASMETRPRNRSPLPVPAGEVDREHAILDSREGAKDRTREWVAKQGSSLDVSRIPSNANADSEHGAATKTHRPHRSEPYPSRPRGPSDAQLHHPRPVDVKPQAEDVERERESVGDDLRVSDTPPRLDIPFSLMPGGSLSGAPTQLPFDLGPMKSELAQSQAAEPSNPSDKERSAHGHAEDR